MTSTRGESAVVSNQPEKPPRVSFRSGEFGTADPEQDITGYIVEGLNRGHWDFSLFFFFALISNSLPFTFLSERLSSHARTHTHKKKITCYSAQLWLHALGDPPRINGY